MPLASASMKNRSEEVGLGIMNGDSANQHGIAGDYHPNNTAIPLPMISVPPFSSWNMNETSQCYSKEIEPAGGGSMIDSSQFKSDQNFEMGHHYPYEGQELKPLPCISVSGFSCPQGYTGWPYQYTRQDTQTISDDMMNAAFNLNSLEKPHNGGKSATPSYSSAGWPQMVNPNGTAMSHNTGQPLLNMNFGMAMFNPNHGGEESSLTPGKLDERFMTVGSGINRDSKSNTIIPRINVTDNSERMFLPPINTYHHQLGSRSFLNPGVDMNGASSASLNNNEVMSNLSHTGNHEVLFDTRPGLRLGPSYAFQRSAAGDQNHYLKQGFERCTALPSLPYGSQTMPCDGRQSRVNEQLVPYSLGLVTAQRPSELLPKDSGKISSQSFASPPLVTATRSTRGQDSLCYHGQTQVVGSIQQSNSPLGPHSTFDLGLQTGKGNMTAQVSRPSTIASLKRAASQPPSSTEDQRRKTLPAHSFIHPSIQTWTRVAPSAPNTPQPIPPFIHAAQSLTPQATHSLASPMFPTHWSKSAPTAPNTTQSQTVPPVMQTAQFRPPHDKRISFLHPPSHTSSLQPQQLIAQARAQQRLRAPPDIAHIKYKDPTPEPIGHKCFLCRRDLSYSPEGPISQPLAPPAAAVLSCGHTFHEYCLERITPDDQSKDPPCIPCALRE